MLNGEPAYNLATTSVFCDLTVVSETQAVKTDPSVSLEARV